VEIIDDNTQTICISL